MEIIRGKDIEPHIEALGKFRIEIFREYPYLYDGDLQYERRYLGRYARSGESILALLGHAGEIRGACTGIPFRDEDPEFKQAFAGQPIDDIFYIGEVMVRQGFRGKGLGTELLRGVLQLLDPVRYRKVCLFTVDRGAAHPLRPAGYRPPDSLWGRFGFVKETGRVVHYHWKDIGDVAETVKPMHVWTRQG